MVLNAQYAFFDMNTRPETLWHSHIALMTLSQAMPDHPRMLHLFIDVMNLLQTGIYRVVHQPVSRGFAVFADAWLSGWLAEISADLRETVAH